MPTERGSRLSGPQGRAVAHVDLAAVEANCAVLKKAAKRAELCAVVKANGYGHGAVVCAKAALAGGATWLAVATAAEAEELRRHHITDRLLVMGALNHEDVDIALRAAADVVVWRKDFLAAVDKRARALNARANVHIKLDTGMGRLGTADTEEAIALVELAHADRLAGVELAGFMTHFATADERGDDFFEEQLARFTAAVERVKKVKPDCVAHAANSAALLREPRAHFDVVRCGIAIYGLDPFHEDPRQHGLEPALALTSYVADVKRFEEGQTAGYGRKWRAERATDVALVPIGYGDGVRRGLTNRGQVLVRGRRCRLAGTVSMDNIAVDLGEGSGVEPGDQVVLIGTTGGEMILAEDVARELNTINYEITCGIAPRVERQYRL